MLDILNGMDVLVNFEGCWVRVDVAIRSKQTVVGSNLP
jgi:hypothetical protein